MLDLASLISDSRSGLYEVVIGITSKCNLNCSFCYSNSKASNVFFIEFGKLMEIFADLKNLDVKIIALSGGEPLLHPDFLRIAEEAARTFPVVFLATNGFFIDEAMAMNIKKAGIKNVQLSIEGDEGSHNALRGNPQSFTRALNAAKFLKQAGVDVTLTPTFQKDNLNQLKYVWNLAKSLGCDLSIKRLISTGRASKQNEITAADYKTLYDFAVEENKHSTGSKIFIHCDPLRVLYKEPGSFDASRLTGCIAGFALLYIKFNGDVYPCSKLPLRMGNVYSEKLADILDSEIVRSMKNRAKLQGKCSVCDLKYACGGCRASAFAYSSNLFAQDPLCWFNAGAA